MKSPNFFVVGAVKTGTSSLAYYLEQHPDIYISHVKEPHFFSSDIRLVDFPPEYRENVSIDVEAYLGNYVLPRIHVGHIEDQSQYMELFREVKDEKVVGELSTSYLYSNCAAENILRFDPDAKVVMILRQPVERAYSHYLMDLSSFAAADIGFIQALENDWASVDKGWGKSHLYIELGMYFEQVQRYLTLFPETQVKVFLYEDYRDDPVGFMEELFGFLEVDSATARSIDFTELKNTASLPRIRFTNDQLRFINKLKKFIGRILPAGLTGLIKSMMVSHQNIPKLRKDEFYHAMKYFREDIKKLSALINRDLQSWYHFQTKEVATKPVAHRNIASGYFYRLIDLLYAPASCFFALIAKAQARLGPERLPLSYRVWDRFQVTPVSHHYYHPVFDVHKLPANLWKTKDPLYGIDFNEDGQLSLLKQFKYQEELRQIPFDKPSDHLVFYHLNRSFENADAEMFYNMIRHYKPRRVIEIGSGHSTRIAKLALDKNENDGYSSKHLCIEPYEMPWLEQLGVDEVIRRKVEDVDPRFFDELEARDILFIDSSHVLRTGGDVFVEYLHILPTLKPGVLVHIHDIFLPYEYPKNWLVNERRFWTEQYLLQAFLVCNREFEILSAVHWLARDHSDLLAGVCPAYSKLGGAPGSFWIRRVG